MMGHYTEIYLKTTICSIKFASEVTHNVPKEKNKAVTIAIAIKNGTNNKNKIRISKQLLRACFNACTMFAIRQSCPIFNLL